MIIIIIITIIKVIIITIIIGYPQNYYDSVVRFSL